MLILYMDESYNNRTMCLGGWLANKEKWREIERAWGERIEYERRISAKRAEPQISRYHASDCASLMGEFSTWERGRQVLFVKRLLRIITAFQPFGVVLGVSVIDYLKHFPSTNKAWRYGLYRLCMWRCLEDVGDVVARCFPGERVAVIHDKGDFDQAAKAAFDMALNGRHGKVFTTIAPISWESSMPLQCADWIAFDGFKALDVRLHCNTDYLRRSLHKLLGKKHPMYVGYITSNLWPLLIQKMREANAKTYEA